MTNDLITNNIIFAKKIARLKYKKYSFLLSYDEIESAAYMGLVDAAGRYDYHKNDNFQLYAYPRIVGAIQDFLRELQWLKYEELDEKIPEKKQIAYDDFFECITSNLNKMSKLAMKLYYIENKKMHEVAQEMRVSESRISQILFNSRNKIKKEFLEVA